jgi:hypothetical protein
MPIKPQTRKLPGLVLYGIVFRILCRVALHADGQEPDHALHQQEAGRRPLRKERVPLSLKLDAGQ